MNTLLVYMVKAAVCLAGFFLIYSLFLRRDTNYVRNRIFILASMLTAFLLPFITIQTGKPVLIPFFGKTLSEILVTGTQNSSDLTASGGTNSSGIPILNKIYFAGILVTGIKLLADIIKLLYLIIRRKDKENYIIMFNGFGTSGFSALGYIFINSSLSREEAEEIIKHEQNHLDRNHFADILFIEIIGLFQWFNPVIYLFNRSLRAIHEYQADQGYLSSGKSVLKYQNLLLCHVFKSKIVGITNSFSNPSLIKKRIIMMTKEPTPALANLKLLLVLPVIASLLMAFSSCSKKEIPSSSQFNAEKLREVFVVVEEMPQFPGGDSALMNFISKNIKYPEKAKAKGITGRVILKFMITNTGEVDDVTVIKGADPLLDAEAVRVAKLLPSFKPGKQGGKPVNVWFNIPVMFSLK